MREMSNDERVVSLAADEADERTNKGTETGPGVWHGHFLDSLREQGYALTKLDTSEWTNVDGLDLRLSFEPDAIREHFQDDDPDPTEGMTDEQLAQVGVTALTDDGIYRAFHESLIWALDTDETKED